MEKSIDLLIVDDAFPHPISRFRYEELMQMMRQFPKSRLVCTGKALGLLGSESLDDLLCTFLNNNEALRTNIISLADTELDECFSTAHFAYFCFLHNTHSMLEYIERHQVPFAFELYPGGGFSLNNPSSEEMLRRVLCSPCFRKVIVTQDITRDYLLDKGLCRPDQIEEIFGVVIPQDTMAMSLLSTSTENDSVLKVCFAAMRYTTNGADKGYDIFLDVARHLLSHHRNMEFHVIGMFDAETIPLETELKEKLIFHGVLANAEFHRVMQQMDIILSANVNNVITTGAFDGFPTASCIEAGLNGVLIMCTDPLELNNSRFRNHEEIEIIEHDVLSIVERIDFYYHNRAQLHNVVKKQYEKIQQLYAPEIQLGKRLTMIQKEILFAKDAENKI